VCEREKKKGLKKGGDLLGGGAGGMFSYMSRWHGTCGFRPCTFIYILNLICYVAEYVCIKQLV
jgi:hypothetical protein